ncbi:hypothetical protein B0H19DRAFT_1259647 [Mycena capillaripes]|nr:hypothetical protein B0H19DRAFT_1259647 [Mycena capillaripes]
MACLPISNSFFFKLKKVGLQARLGTGRRELLRPPIYAFEIDYLLKTQAQPQTLNCELLYMQSETDANPGDIAANNKKRKFDAKDVLSGPTVPENTWAFDLMRRYLHKPFDHPNEEAKSVVLAVLEFLATCSTPICCLSPNPVIQPTDSSYPSIEAVFTDLLQDNNITFQVLGRGDAAEDSVSAFLTRFSCRQDQDPLVASMSIDATSAGIASCRLDFPAMIAALGPDFAIQTNADVFIEAKCACLVPLAPHEPSKTCFTDNVKQRRQELASAAKLPWVAAGLCPRGWVSGLHIDHCSLAQHFVHCGGEKLWLTWPPTARNLAWWGHHHPVVLDFQQVLIAIEKLEGLQVVHIQERGSFTLPPFHFHTVISFTAAAHVGIVFAHDVFWPQAQVGLDFIKTLVREHSRYGATKTRALVEKVQDELPIWNQLVSRRGVKGVGQWLQDTQRIYDDLLCNASA